jgi:hypothetical protein
MSALKTMKPRALLVLCCAVWLAADPPPVAAWGMDVHRMLTRRAIDGLSEPLKTFFAVRRDFVVEHAADPDLWRIAALKSGFGDEDPNHFLDIDDLGEASPFANVPRTWDGLVARYGIERANKTGRLPWRAEEIYERLVSAFREMGRPGGSPYAADDARYLASALSHYVEDAHQPFHATVNYDGRATNQRGIHARFENDLPLRNLSRLKLAPVVVRPVPNLVEFMFAVIVRSQALVEPLLRADRDAAAGRELYDDAYFEALFKTAEPVLEQRLSESSSAVASVIVAAWQQAGSPVPQTDGPRPPARIR